MEILKILWLSLASIATLFVLTKIMGNKEMSQLNMFDYCIGITIGSIAAEMATALESSFIQPLTAMAVYAIVTIIISSISNHSLKARRIVEGRTLILLDDGKLYRNNFKKGKLDLNEFLMQYRTNGYFNISQIQTTILESNGKISFLPKVGAKTVTPEDLNLKIKQEKIVLNVILDGIILEENLKILDKDKKWLIKQANKQGIKDINKIFLATCDQENNLSIYKKLNNDNSDDMF